IALIKYMGKTNAADNSPCNSSLSYTLDHLRTFVRLQQDDNLTSDQWAALKRSDLRPIELSEKGRSKFLNHFQFLKEEFLIPGFFQIESANNFPSDCGLASSASSYAALTVTAHQWALQNKTISEPKTTSQLAFLSKKGSGSSCRSLYSPWAMWSKFAVEPVELPYAQLKHQVILCDESIKTVSSSDAHKQVLTSDLFFNRPERAEERLVDLKLAFSRSDWARAFQICWNEFWDMHVLFHTSKPAFMYMNSGSQMALTLLLKHWELNGDGPLVTMDAGSNIHLLYRPDQTEVYNSLRDLFSQSFSVWTDEGYIAKK
ncbi:MAG: diphosphomevalonate decarboxylase, partial [Bdellovibrio sp.]|nr:diphosphomevalonate decarboxylase [Bdellovibrio sp.]